MVYLTNLVFAKRPRILGRFFVCSVLALSGLFLADRAEAQGCPQGYQCGEEYWDQPSPPKEPVSQPSADGTVLGACGEPLPKGQDYNAQIHPAQCGEGADARVRMPLKVPEEVMSEWSEWSRSGHPDAQAKMQEVRKHELSWEGIVEVPVSESWTYQVRVGGFNGSRCGYETIDTTCYRDTYATKTRTVREAYKVCAEYSKPAPPPPSSGGSSGSDGWGGGGSSNSGGGSGGGSSSSPWSNPPSSKPSGSGESREEQKKESQDSMDDAFGDSESPDERENSFALASIFGSVKAAQSCIRYETRYRDVNQTVSVFAGTISYACQKRQELWCEWMEPREGSRACGNKKIPYEVVYKHNDYWKPGYDGGGDPVREYVDILPNQWDLLVGESETIYVWANTGRSETLSPSMIIESEWNEYEYEVPQNVQCDLKSSQKLEFHVRSKGRIKRKAPNPLSLPVDENGDPVEALEFEYHNGKKWRPMSVELQDQARVLMLEAARHSRSFPRPDNAREQDAEAIYSSGLADVGDIVRGWEDGYWQETRYFMQLFRYDKFGRTVRISLPNTFSSNEADIVGDRVIISFLGENGLDRLYRPSGPLEFIFGGIYSKFGVELSPGGKYFIKLMVAQRGLPFYESGCRDGGDICEGEEASRDSFSEPVVIHFSPEADHRSWLKRWKDWKERIMIY